MVIFKEITPLRRYLQKEVLKGGRIGFIPTMGALHQGHLSLIDNSKNRKQITVCSIFLNPTQFNNPDDFVKYPISIDADIALLLNHHCDVLFLPSTDEIYPGGSQNTPVYEFGAIDTILEAAQRPGHFKGVGQVVARLLQIVNPDMLFLGQKDYQQCIVIQQLREQLHLTELQIEICPTVREPDGLAMSSRNRRLSQMQRNVAHNIYSCLQLIRMKKTETSFANVHRECVGLLTENGFKVEYITLAQADTLEILTNYSSHVPTVALIAARLGDIRLIDNLIL